MVWMDAIRGSIVIAGAILLNYHLLEIWMLDLTAVLLGSYSGIFVPAASAIIPNIVKEDQLTQATSMDQFTGSFCAAFRLLVSGLLYNLIGVIGYQHNYKSVQLFRHECDSPSDAVKTDFLWNRYRKP